MKKLLSLLFLFFLALNFTILSENETKNNTEERQDESKLTKSEIAKITAALIGCSFFTTATIMTPQVINLIKCHSSAKTIHFPTGVVLAAIILLTEPFLKNQGFNKETQLQIVGSLTATISPLLASGFGFYVYKKLSKSSKHGKTALSNENLNKNNDSL